MHRFLSLVLLSCIVGLGFAVGCGETGGGGSDAGMGRADGGAAGPDADEIINPVPDTGPKPDTGGVGPTNTIIYAHTGTSLFQGSPSSRRM